MFYTSTRSRMQLDSAAAIARGIAPDGGLFVPESFPRISSDMLKELVSLDYRGRAEKILALYLTDFTQTEIRRCVSGAYTGSFENDVPAPMKEVRPGVHFLELWHGPTCAFKDLALQLLPYLLTTASKKSAPGETKVILVATSGDTGKAALAGFADVEGTKIIVFYPENGVSAMQKLQMVTQEGKNVAVCAVKGNFDDAQTGVKTIFGDAGFSKALAAKGLSFSSANSINFGRLVPQVVYYVSAYCDLLKSGKIALGDRVNVAVPTGNFGNILAAWYAKQMGIPFGKFICASNSNNVLSDFFLTGVYDRNRPFHTTVSPSMDILISSNLERLLYHLTGAEENSSCMAALKSSGRYEISASAKAKLDSEFYGNWCSEEETKRAIGELFREYGYLCDTHTAVAASVLRRYQEETGDRTPCIVASTASPFKFAPAVLGAISADTLPQDDFALLEKLSSIGKLPVPAPLAELKSKTPLHRSVAEKSGMKEFICNFLQ